MEISKSTGAADFATAAERAAVDEILSPPPSPWLGGQRSPRALHVARRDGDSVPPRSLLLPALRALEARVGRVSQGAVSYLAVRMDLPPAEIYGVAAFYALLHVGEDAPPVKVHVCDDVACQLSGVGGLITALRERYGDEGEASSDGVAWHRSPCLGQCDRGPAVLVQRAGAHAADIEVVAATRDDVERAIAAANPSPTPPAVVPQAGAPSLVVLRHLGRVDPTDLDSYRRAGGYESLRRALQLGPAGVVDWVADAGLQGRGGAAFPTGVKWRAVAGQADRTHYVVANADESEPGTFKDRVLMEEDPFAVVEALTVAGYAVGAEQGYIYVRAEYPLAAARLRHAIAAARQRGFLGDDVMGRGLRFDLDVRQGAGAYICGEETALFNSLEGRRGEPRNKPPFPTTHGLFGKPTAVNNIETLMNVLAILEFGPEKFRAVGAKDAAGTRLFCLSGAVARPGLYEAPFGTRLGALIDMAGGLLPGRTLQAVLLGGAAGSFVGPAALDTPLAPADLKAIGATLGSGVVVVFDDTANLRDTVLRIARFFRDESCGQCVPCRVGTVRQEELVARLAAGRPHGAVAEEVLLFRDIAQVMRDASICGLGQTAANAVDSAIRLGLLGGEGRMA